MADYGKAMKEVREVMKENGIKSFAVAMDKDASCWSYSKHDKESIVAKAVLAMKDNK